MSSELLRERTRSYLDAALLAGIHARDAELAAVQVEAGNVTLLALSGKQGAGKDAIAPLVMRALRVESAIRVSFGAAVVAEGDSVIRCLRRALTSDDAAGRLARECGLGAEDAKALTALLWNLSREGAIARATDRHRSIRLALQRLGAARRTQDANYWLRPAFRRILRAVAQGRSVYVTDVRTLREAEHLRMLGFFLVRIDVDAATQAMRLARRDPSDGAPSGADHPDETAMDRYANFDLRLSNGSEESLSTDASIVQRIAAAITAQPVRSRARYAQ